ncbi:MAG: BON domain-containing protein [Caedimonas sp.]|nr:BON domain-containing protein [Caedimonas sp.]
MRTINRHGAILMTLLGISFLTACSVISDRETLGEYVDDAGITAKVKTAILNDPGLAPFQIHVETFQNVVQLSGFVDSPQQTAKAERIARSIGGVRTVKNNLVVR